MFCKQMIDCFVYFCTDYCFTKCLKSLSTPMGKLSYDGELHIQTLWGKGLGAKAIISTFPVTLIIIGAKIKQSSE